MNANSSLFKSSRHAHLRVADILLLDEDEDREEAAEGGDSSSPMDGCSGFFSRWLCRLRGAKVNREDRDPAQNTKRSINLLNGGGLPAPVPQNDQSGGCRCRRDSSMGVECSLLCLIAASKIELDKMTELRTQMIMLLQNFKEELEVRNTLVKPSQGMGPNCHYSSQKLMTKCVKPESSTTAIMTCEQSLQFDASKEEEYSEGIGELQAELEAELERLQLHLGGDKLLHPPEQQSIEVTVKDTSSSVSQSSGEVIDPVIETEEACLNRHYDYCVPPHELERRLHELLESRQQEQIRELEVALECARQKLHEKEMEISWWKDTATMISKHISGPSRCIVERG